MERTGAHRICIYPQWGLRGGAWPIVFKHRPTRSNMLERLFVILLEDRGPPLATAKEQASDYLYYGRRAVPAAWHTPKSEAPSPTGLSRDGRPASVQRARGVNCRLWCSHRLGGEGTLGGAAEAEMLGKAESVSVQVVFWRYLVFQGLVGGGVGLSTK